MRPASLVVGAGRPASEEALPLCGDGGRWWGQEVRTAGEPLFQGQGMTPQKAEGERKWEWAGNTEPPRLWDGGEGGPKDHPVLRRKKDDTPRFVLIPV